MLKLKKVAVTGGLASGKSSACKFLKELGAYVVSADEIVHQLLSPTTQVGQQVIELLGSDIVVDGQIDRNRIAEIVFSQPKLLQKLESLLHPAVDKEIERQYQKRAENQSCPLFVVEIPLLFEKGWHRLFDQVIVVSADPEQCRQRFVKLTGFPENEYNKRMSYQLPPSEKESKADYVLNNHGDLHELQNQVKHLFNQLTRVSVK